MLPIIREKEFYRNVGRIAIPLALQNLISVGVAMTDTVVLGHMGEAAISASSLANQLYFIFTFALYGLSGGSIVLAAQYWGKKDTRTISKVLGISLRISIGIGVLFTLIGLLMPQQFMYLYSKDPDVIAGGVSYLRIIAFSYVLSAITVIYLGVLRSMENVKISLVVNCSSFAVNLVLNLIFVYGLFGMPKMGIPGAALATLIARGVEVTIIFLYSSFFYKSFRFHLIDLVTLDRPLFRDYLHYSVPVVVNEFMWGSGASMQAAIIGNLGKYASASYNIVGVIQRLVTVLIFGSCDAATVIMGKTIGSGDEKGARKAGNTFLLLSVLLGVISIGLVGLAGSAALNLGVFDMSEKTNQYIRIMLYGTSVFVFCQSYNAMNIVGIMRGGGDTRTAMLIDTITMWFLSLPVGLLAGYVLKLSPPFVYICLSCDELVKIFICTWRFRSGKWLHNVTRE